MATYKTFEEMEIWQLSMQLCNEVYRLTNEDLFAKDYGLKDQIRRSSVSVPSNIAEGFERDSKNQFLYFLTISKGSLGEMRTQLRIATSLGYMNESVFNELNEKSISLGKQIGGFITYLKNYKNK